MSGEEEQDLSVAQPKERDTYTAQFAVRAGEPVSDEPLGAEFQERFDTQTDFEWKRIYPEPQSAEALERFREGNRAFREDRILDAIEAYRACLALENYAPAQQNLAVALLHEASAESWFSCEAILGELIHRFERLSSGETSTDLNQDQLASVLGPAYRNMAELLTQQAVAERSREKLDHAAAYTERALALSPGNTAWWLELWGILHLSDRAEESAEALRRAAALADFEQISQHVREKYTALKVKYHGN